MNGQKVGKWRDWPHIIEMQQFDRKHLELIWDMSDHPDRIDTNPLEGKRIGIFFAQESTRTYWSFIFAADSLGAKVFYDNSFAVTSSVAKGESYTATMGIISGYGRLDLFVLRFPKDWVYRVKERIGKPTVNGGAGNLQHPTQAFIDGHIFRKKLGTLDGKKFLIFGDLQNSRAAHSLAYELCMFDDVEITFLSPESRPIPVGIREHMREKGVKFRELTDRTMPSLDEVFSEHNGVYAIRPQTNLDEEKLSSERVAEMYRPFHVTQKALDALKGVLTHPLPNTDVELPDAIIDANDSIKEVNGRFVQTGGKIVANEAAIISGLETRKVALKLCLVPGLLE
ncbi:MAG: hypothetical protein WC528_05235 [Patescibacteria group bacterium]